MKKLKIGLLFLGGILISQLSSAQNYELTNNNSSCSVTFVLSWQSVGSCGTTITNVPYVVGAGVQTSGTRNGDRVVSATYQFAGQSSVSITTNKCGGGPGGGVGIPITDCTSSSTTLGWDDNTFPAPQQFYVN